MIMCEQMNSKGRGTQYQVKNILPFCSCEVTPLCSTIVDGESIVTFKYIRSKCKVYFRSKTSKVK